MTHQLMFEKSLWDKGIELIAGLDEVGRGALAGPMVVGAVILRRADLLRVYDLLTNNDIRPENPSFLKYVQIKDSKMLSPKKRGDLSSFIINNCLCYSIFQISNNEIDKLGISACTQVAFSGVIKSLSIKPEHILTDAFAVKEFPQFVQTNIKKGDRLSLSISAASIVVKVFRDNLMIKLAENKNYKAYEFDRHKGYGTRLHLEKITQYGTSNIHRKSFIHI